MGDLLLFRFATRQLLAFLFQFLPRFTRLDPKDGPPGLLPGGLRRERQKERGEGGGENDTRCGHNFPAYLKRWLSDRLQVIVTGAGAAVNTFWLTTTTTTTDEEQRFSKV